MRGWGSRNALFVIGLGVLAALSACDRRHMGDATGKLLVLPSRLDFDRVPMFGGADLELTLRNVGRGPVAVEEVYVEASDGSTYAAEFTTEGPHSLRAADTDNLRVKFRPVKDGVQAATLVVRNDNPEEPLLRIPLSGQGVDAKAVVDSGLLDFGRIEAETTKTLQLTYKNISDLHIVVGTQVVGADADEFSVPNTFPLGPNEQKTVDVTFAPTRVGVKDAKLVVEPCRNCPTYDVAIRAEALDRAVVAEPWELDFGPVPMDRDAHLLATLHNISTEPVTLNGMGLAEGTDVSFTYTEGTFAYVLGPDQRVQYEVRYSPGHMGGAVGSLEFDVQSVRNPKTIVPLRGYGGAPELCISPLSWDFGTVPVGSKNTKIVNIKNCGTNNEAPLELKSIRFGGEGVPGEDEYSFEAPPMPVRLAAGEEINVKVFYEPDREADAGGYLHIGTSIFGYEDARVGFNGRARTSTDCRISMSPMVVDFGTVEPGLGAVLGLKIRNDGADICAVKNIRLQDNPDGVFGLPGGNLDGLLIYPGDYFSFMIWFRPPAGGGRFAGTLNVESADPAKPQTLVPLIGNSQQSCLVATPRYVDFGVARPDCPPAAREVNFSNQCATPIDLNGVRIGAGTTDGEFVIDQISNGLPRTLAPGDSVNVSVKYLAQVAGLNLSPLYADVSGIREPLLVSLVGESTRRTDRTDSFIQQDGGKVDVLFVVDNTASMVEEQPKFISALPAFVDAAKTRNVDLHVAITTTGIETASNACPGGAQGGEAGRFFPADNSNQRMFNLQSANLAAELQQNANVGLCAFVEQGFEAMRRALTDPLVSKADDPRTPLANDGNLGFYREEAALAVVFVGDEDDHSPDSVDTYVRFLQSKKGVSQPNRAVIYAIAPTGSACASAGGNGTRYATAAARTGGQVMDICSADYAPMLREVANKAFGPQDRFPLSGNPDGSGFTVTIDGTQVTTGWSYDAATNSIVFSTMPPPGARIRITYRMSC